MKRLLLGLALCAFTAPAFAGGQGRGDEDGYDTGGGYERSAGGYEAHGWGVSRTEESGEAWRYRRLDDDRGPPPCQRDDGRRGAYDERDEDAGCGPPPQEVVLRGDFFEDGGGVGVIPEGGGGGGGFGFVDGGFAGASAHAFAFASASARVSVRFHGGFTPPMRPHMPPHHSGGCGCKH